MTPEELREWCVRTRLCFAGSGVEPSAALSVSAVEQLLVRCESAEERLREQAGEIAALRAFRDAAVKALRSIEFNCDYTVGPGSAVRNEVLVDHTLVAAALALAGDQTTNPKE